MDVDMVVVVVVVVVVVSAGVEFWGRKGDMATSEGGEVEVAAVREARVDAAGRYWVGGANRGCVLSCTLPELPGREGVPVGLSGSCSGTLPVGNAYLIRMVLVRVR